MSARRVGGLILVAAFVALAAGCVSSPTKQTVTQPTATGGVATQTPQPIAAAGDSVTAERTGTFLQYITKDAVATNDENSGMALVTLFPTGTAVGATCGIRGLVAGDSVTIQQFPQSFWIVTGKL